MILLNDADILCFKFACINEYEIDWGEGVKSAQRFKRKAIMNMTAYAEHLQKEANCREQIMVLSGPNNFRYDVMPSYKGSRPPKPALMAVLKQHILDNYPSKMKDGLEGDDTCGIMMTNEPDKYVCCTLDKDLKQIPGTHFHMNREEFFYVDAEGGEYFFYTQILTGDRTDFYFGCPGIGAAKAAKVLDGFSLDCLPEMWSRIVETYESKGLTEADAIQQARCARILTNKDYDFKKEKPILWTPPTE